MLEQEILKKVDENTVAIAQNTADIKELKEAVKQNTVAIKQNTADIKELKEAVKQNTAVIEQNTADIKELKEAVKQNTVAIAQNTADIKELKEDVKQIKEELNDHSRILLIIEDAVTNKIPALFDKFSMHDDRFEKDEYRIERVENVTEHHTTQIAALELTTTSIQKELKN